ncbi:MAG: hypothetical protein CMH61_02370 [Nanoarchaeota archaeon]|nr:hypothetical protein [Nanoarchaeota archaeon]
MVLIAKISKGSQMDQVYLPKSRPPGFAVGNRVEIKPTRKRKKSFYTHHVQSFEPIKQLMVNEIFDYFAHVDNILITGSFLEKGFYFNDVDIVVINEISEEQLWKDYFKKALGINVHIICINRKSLLKGLRTDPLFQLMLNRYIAKKREFFRYHNEFHYKILDLHVHSSKSLIDSFDLLTGGEKYKLVRNLIAIRLFLVKKQLTKKSVNKEMEKLFGKNVISELQNNMVEKRIFLKKYKAVYKKTFNKIMKSIKNDSK